MKDTKMKKTYISPVTEIVDNQAAAAYLISESGFKMVSSSKTTSSDPTSADYEEADAKGTSLWDNEW